MANTYKLINSASVGSGGATTVTFSSIPATYTDLKLVYSCRDTGNNGGRAYVYFSVNGTGTFTGKWLAGYDSGSKLSTGFTGSGASLGGSEPDSVSTANVFGNGEIYFVNYTDSNNKTFSADAISENNSTSSWMNVMVASTWSSTAAINSITLNTGTVGFAQNSTFYLYGIKNS